MASGWRAVGRRLWQRRQRLDVRPRSRENDAFTLLNAVPYTDPARLGVDGQHPLTRLGEETRMGDDRGPGGPRERAEGAAAFRPVKSAYRALDVLEALADGPASPSELARLLEIPKSSLHGLLRTLSERGWVTAADGGARFRLGLRALQVGTQFVDEDDVVARVAPTLDELAAATGETVQHARLDGDEVVYLAKRDSPHPVRLISRIGSRLPAHATALGKALLAARDDDTVRAVLRFPLPSLTGRTLTGWERLVEDLAATRERGFAVDDGEATDGLRCFAVAVPPDRRHQQQPPTDAVSVSVPSFRLDEQREAELVRALLDQQRRLGGRASAR
jgi:DNA-binding IclR family transcriptional regulator